MDALLQRNFTHYDNNGDDAAAVAAVMYPLSSFPHLVK